MNPPSRRTSVLGIDTNQIGALSPPGLLLGLYLAMGERGAGCGGLTPGCSEANRVPHRLYIRGLLNIVAVTIGDIAVARHRLLPRPAR